MTSSGGPESNGRLGIVVQRTESQHVGVVVIDRVMLSVALAQIA